MIEQLNNFDWNSFSQALMTGDAHRHLLVGTFVIIGGSLIYFFLSLGGYSNQAKFYAKVVVCLAFLDLGFAGYTALSNMNEHKSDMDKNITMNSDSSLTDMMDDTMKQLKEKGLK